MAIVFNNLGVNAAPDINDSSDATIYTGASVTPPTSGLALQFVYAQASTTGTVATPTVTGWGVPWSLIRNRTGGVNHIYLFAANLSGATAGAITVDFGGNLQVGCRSSLVQATGVDLSGGVSGAIVQSAIAGGSTGTAQSLSLAAAASDPDNRSIFGVYHTLNEDIVPGAEWVTLDELAGTNPAAVFLTAHSDDAFEQTATVSWATVQAWGLIIAEIKAGTLAALEGTASVTLADATSTATATLAGRGSLATTFAALTASITGTVADASGVLPISAPFNLVQKGHNGYTGSVTTPSISLSAGNVLIAVVGINNSNNPNPIATISLGNGTLTGVEPWTQIEQQKHDATTDTHLAMWWTRVGELDTAGTVTASVDIEANTWHIILFEIDGALVSGDIKVQSTKSLLSGITSTPTLQGFAESIPGNLVIAALNSRGTITDIQPGVQFSELVDGRPPDGNGTVWLNVQYALNPVTVVDWSNAGTTRNVAVAVEIASQANTENPTGRLVQELAGVTLASDGTVVNYGAPTLNVTLDDLFSSIQGKLAITGQTSATLEDATVQASIGLAIFLDVTLQGVHTALVGSPLGLLLAVTQNREYATGLLGEGAGVNTGRVDVTLENLESAITGALNVTGESVTALDDMTVFAYAYILNQLAMEVTVGLASMEASATLAIASHVDATLADASMDAQAILAIAGQFNIALQGATLTADLVPGILAEFIATLDDAISTGNASVLAQGTFNAVLGDASIIASIVALIQGNLVTTLEDSSLAASIDVVPHIDGELESSLAGVNLLAAGSSSFEAAMLATLQDATLAGVARNVATGIAQSTLEGAALVVATVSVHVSGEFNYPYLSASVAATGSVEPGITGELSLVLDYATLSTEISVNVQGESHPALDGATAAGQAISTITGNAAATLDGVYTDQATSTARIQAQIAATLSEAIVTSAGRLPVTGLASLPLAGITTAAHGTSSVVAQVSLALDGIQLFTYGVKGEIPAGQAVIQLQGVTLNVDAMVALSGTLISTLADVTSQITAQVPALAEFSTQLADVSADSEALARIQGYTTPILDGVTASSMAVVVILGAIRSRLAGATLAAEVEPILVSVEVGFIYGPKATGDIVGVGSIHFVGG